MIPHISVSMASMVSLKIIFIAVFPPPPPTHTFVHQITKAWAHADLFLIVFHKDQMLKIINISNTYTMYVCMYVT